MREGTLMLSQGETASYHVWSFQPSRTSGFPPFRRIPRFRIFRRDMEVMGRRHTKGAVDTGGAQ